MTTKSCDGCRFILEDRVGDQDAKFCRAAPPTTLRYYVKDPEGRQNLTWNCAYPPCPKIRCGQYRRRHWWWPWG